MLEIFQAFGDARVDDPALLRGVLIGEASQCAPLVLKALLLAQDERLYQQLVDLSQNANTLATKIDVNQSRVSNQLVSLAGSLDSLAQRMQHGPGTMAQLMTDGTLHRRLASSSTRADSILGAIVAGRGTLGRLYADSTLYDDTKALMASMKRLMSEIEKNPKKYLKFSLF